MQIDTNLLFSWGAVAKKYTRSEVIFEEDQMPHFYYQILDGSIRMFNCNDDGKEFTQGIFGPGESFGEPPLLIGESYPANAIAILDTTVVKLSADKFFRILQEYPDVQRNFLLLMANRIHSKSRTSKEIINQKPEFRITAFLNTFKKKSGKGQERILIPFTRQEIGNFTGLRVETVIRVLCKMNTLKKVEIINHKIYY